MSTRRVLLKDFYARSPEIVARELLGKTLVRILRGENLESYIVETEAYYGECDPASRAYHGKKSYNDVMWGEPGHLFVYNVHRYWMLNVVAHIPGGVGGVLIRAVEPRRGVDTMMKLRPVRDLVELTSGPGKVSLALSITKELNGLAVTDIDSPIHILDAPKHPYVMSHRIGVTRDLTEELRFYIPGNTFVSH